VEETRRGGILCDRQINAPIVVVICEGGATLLTENGDAALTSRRGTQATLSVAQQKQPTAAVVSGKFRGQSKKILT
jgi:hypothetical protein